MRMKSSFRFMKSKFIRVNSDFICEKFIPKWYISSQTSLPFLSCCNPTTTTTPYRIFLLYHPRLPCPFYVIEQQHPILCIGGALSMVTVKPPPPVAVPLLASRTCQTTKSNQLTYRQKGDSKVNKLFGLNYALLSAGPTAPAETIAVADCT